jgi:parvulin-like peptidyl-prolyl isomerase
MQHLRLSVLLLSLTLTASAQIAPYAPSAMENSGFQSLTVSATGKPVARVNGASLTDKDLVREMLAMFPYASQHGGKFPKAMEADIRRGALAMLEFEELVYQEAERRKMTVSRPRLDTAVETFNAQFSSPEQFHEYLKNEFNGSAHALRSKIRRSMLIDDLLKVEVTRKAGITDGDVRSYYDKHRTNFYFPESVSIQTISITVPEHASPPESEKIKQRAEQAYAQAKNTKNYQEFGLLAERVSEDDWRVMMGDHHEVTRAEMPPEIAKAAFELKPGEISQLMHSENWWCIVRLNSKQAGRQQEFAEVKASLKKQLVATKTEDLRGALHRELRKKARIEEL